MKTWILLAILPMVMHSPSYAQSVEWVQTFIASGGQVGNAAYADDLGNMYVTGYFTGDMNVQGVSMTAQGFGDAYLIKLSPDGNMLWARQSEGPGFNGGRDITVDDMGNVYLTGRIEGQTAFGELSVTGAGDNDIFIAKYDANGVEQWVASGGGIGPDWGNGIAVDQAGNVTIAGYFSNTATFDGNEFTSNGGHDIIVAQYTNDGIFAWALTAGGAQDDDGFDVALDDANAIYVAGVFSGTLSLGEIDIVAQGASESIIAKISNDGTPEWVVFSAGPGANNSESIATNAAGDVFVAGVFEQTATFGAQSVTSAGAKDIYVAKYNSDGDLVRLTTMGGAQDDGAASFGQGLAIAADTDDGFWLTSTFTGNADIGNIPVNGKGEADIFTARFDAQAEAQWVEVCAGNGLDNFIGLGAAPDGVAYVVGNFLSDPFECGDVSIPLEGFQLNTFIAKIAPESAPLPRIEVTAAELHLGPVQVGMFDEATYEIRPVNEAGVTIETIAFENPNEAAAQGLTIVSPTAGDFPIELAEGQSLTVRVRFEPETPIVVYQRSFISSSAERPIVFVGVNAIGEPVVSVGETETYDSGIEIELLPNPAVRELEALIETVHSGTANIMLRDALGKTATRKNYRLEKGFNRVKLDAGMLQAGIYFLTVQIGGRQITRKLQIMR